ncbi:hypothetical protein R5R35_011472 [Gryllus longicercus]|uniref:Pickpocket n=1 Tax=Gryllus longicercus TaxID=2509291 RepID=A0AAN9Z416_9ORTH
MCASVAGLGARQVMLHAPDQFPEVGRGTLVLRREGHRARAMLQVVAALTGSTAAVRALPPARRACYFPEERALPAGAAYSQVACLLDCRLTHIRRVCGCVPYFFSAAFPDVKTCNVSGVLCIGGEHVALRFFSPPGAPLKAAAAAAEDGPALNCSQCLPSCSNSRYSVEVLSWHQTVDETSVANPQFNACDAYIDVHFKDLSAVLYRRDVAFDDMQLLVSFGGITGLFLGVSLLSAVELGYFALRLLAAAARAARAALGGAPRPPLAPAPAPAPDPPAPPLYAWLP